MQSGKSMGKTVIVNDESSIVAAPVQLNSRSVVRADASYLITGGTGGLGRALTKWLIDMGARHIVLISRSGGDMTADSALRQTITWANDHGAQVYVAACDVSNDLDVKSLISGLEAQRIPPFAGVIHGAMVLKVRRRPPSPNDFRFWYSIANILTQDSLFEKDNLSDWSAVINPKIHGALNIHNALSGRELDFFICLSSIISIAGNHGQSSYGGSNAFLDAFCGFRNSQGLPATAINLPAISEVGYVAEAIAAGTGKAMESYYTAAISQSQLRSILESTTSVDSTHGARVASGQVIVGLSTLPELMQMYVGSGPLLSLQYRHIEAKASAPANSSKSGETGKASLKRSLAGMDLTEDAARDVLYAGIADKIASILMIPREDVRPDRPLEDLGLDSLISVELRNWLVRELEISLSVIDIADSTSVKDLSDKVAARMGT
jgi:NAD(P)-dependent dehydrogenase (short-subunit alcohol dehydrogenase family)/acyl carrier protein